MSPKPQSPDGDAIGRKAEGGGEQPALPLRRGSRVTLTCPAGMCGRLCTCDLPGSMTQVTLSSRTVSRFV